MPSNEKSGIEKENIGIFKKKEQGKRDYEILRKTFVRSWKPHD